MQEMFKEGGLLLGKPHESGGMWESKICESQRLAGVVCPLANVMPSILWNHFCLQSKVENHILRIIWKKKKHGLVGLLIVTNVLLGWGILIMEEATHVWVSGHIGNLCTFLSVLCEPKTALRKIKSILK